MRLRRGHQGPPGATVYYLGWAGMSMPRTPTDPTSEAEAIRRQSFYRAEYDDQGRLAKFTKIMNGQVDWSDEYRYWDNGKLRQRTMTRGDGSQRHEDYDRRGKLVQ